MRVRKLPMSQALMDLRAVQQRPRSWQDGKSDFGEPAPPLSNKRLKYNIEKDPPDPTPLYNSAKAYTDIRRAKGSFEGKTDKQPIMPGGKRHRMRPSKTVR
jgi:hypothetical protein